MGKFSIHLSKEEEKIIEGLIRDGYAKNKKEALKLLYYAELKDQLENKQNEKPPETEIEPEPEPEENPEELKELDVSKPDEALSKIVLYEYMNAKKKAIKPRSSFLEELGLKYITEKLNLVDNLLKENLELRKEIAKLQNNSKMAEEVMKHLPLVIKIVAKKMGINLEEGGENEEAQYEKPEIE